MKKIRIEIATLDSIRELAILHRELRNTENNYDSNLNEIENGKDRESKFRDFLLRERTICYIARLDDEFIGYVSGYIADDLTVYKEPVGELAAIVVVQRCRNHGIGEQLLKQFEKWCVGNGAKYIRLSVFYNNHKAISMYKKNGYGEYTIDLRKKI